MSVRIVNGNVIKKLIEKFLTLLWNVGLKNALKIEQLEIWYKIFLPQNSKNTKKFIFKKYNKKFQLDKYQKLLK